MKLAIITFIGLTAKLGVGVALPKVFKTAREQIQSSDQMILGYNEHGRASR